MRSRAHGLLSDRRCRLSPTPRSGSPSGPMCRRLKVRIPAMPRRLWRSVRTRHCVYRNKLHNHKLGLSGGECSFPLVQQHARCGNAECCRVLHNPRSSWCHDLGVRPQLYIDGPTVGGTTYEVVVPGTVGDVFGQSLGNPETFEFLIDEARPLISIVGGGLATVDPLGLRQTIPVIVRQWDKLRVRLYAVDPSEYWVIPELCVELATESETRLARRAVATGSRRDCRHRDLQ